MQFSSRVHPSIRVRTGSCFGGSMVYADLSQSDVEILVVSLLLGACKDALLQGSCNWLNGLLLEGHSCHQYSPNNAPACYSSFHVSFIPI